jgi:hypothetical protein
MNNTQNNEKTPAESIIPALLTGMVATYLGLTSKGALLKDIATESVSRAVYGEVRRNKDNQHNNNNNNNRRHKHNHGKSKRSKKGAA